MMLNNRPKIQVFDLKRDYLELAELFPGVLVVKIPDDFYWNPLEPPGRSWHGWTGLFASVFSNVFGLFEGSSTECYLHHCLLELGKRYNIKNEEYPCMLDLMDYLKWLWNNKKVDRYSEERHWFGRIRNRVMRINDSLGDMIDCSKGYPLSGLLEKDIIYDISRLVPDVQSFFMETQLVKTILYRMENNLRGGTIRNLVVIDEAKRLLPKYRDESQQSISNISHLIAFAREFGIGLIAAECDPSLLSNSIKSNCYARFCFNQSNGNDIRVCSQSLGLDREQRDYIQKLETGEAIVRLGGRIQRPFVVNVIP